MNNHSPISRRDFCQKSAMALAASASIPSLFNQTNLVNASDSEFQLNYIVGSSMYGEIALSKILPEIKKAGTNYIDIWPKKHGNQREQIKEMGEDAYEKLLEKHQVKTGMLTHYHLGPFRLEQDLPFAKRFQVKLMIAGSSGPKNLKGKELKAAMKVFIEKMKPHVDVFAENDISIGIENHGNALLDSPDSLRYFAELSPSPYLGIAMAPYHLPDDSEVLSKLIRDVGDKLIHFYAWQHGMGCMKKLPKEQELMQMPGRGKLDFVPVIQALKDIQFKGWTEIFMHPVPRGIPILETAPKVTKEINRSRTYLDECVKKA